MRNPHFYVSGKRSMVSLSNPSHPLLSPVDVAGNLHSLVTDTIVHSFVKFTPGKKLHDFIDYMSTVVKIQYLLK